jgi:MoxR-like ATPase
MTTAAETLYRTLRENLNTVVFGLDGPIHGLALALIARGHALLEGAPGLGKTLLAKSLARQLQGEFKRIQCTADMMPSDLTGIHVYNAREGKFELLRGPLFADVVLVDEINRTGPKTQSALLQSMEEGRITLDRQTYRLPENFFVIASQNPHEYEGTYPLLESQLDRFLVKLTVDYPEREVEKRILATYANPGGGHADRAEAIPALPEGLLEAARAEAAAVHVSGAVLDYVVEIASRTRAHAAVSLGLSSRGALAIMRCAKVEAAMRGGEYVTPDDVKTVAGQVAAHRLVLTPEAALEGHNSDAVFAQVLAEVEVPRDEAASS